MRKNKMAGLMAGVLAAALWMTGCSGNGGTETKPAAAGAETGTETAGTSAEKEGSQASGEENKEKEGAALTENKETGKRAILVVSFGTSYNESREATIGAIEKAIAEAFPETETRRAFTSQIIIDKLKERDGLEIDNVKEALNRAAADGITELVVQPTHLADPLLTSDADFDAVAKAITEAMAEYDDGETAFCYMGHGTEADSNQVYPRLQETLKEAGYTDYFIGTVEAEPSLEDVTASLKEAGGYKRVVLRPLMVVAGDHANNDMAGDEEDSWKSVLNKEGYETECVLEGLGQIPAIRELYVQHTKAAMDSLAR